MYPRSRIPRLGVRHTLGQGSYNHIDDVARSAGYDSMRHSALPLA
jgi:hypothetical protein